MSEVAKEKLLIEYLISSPDTFAMCSSILKPIYFAPELRGAVDFVQTYYDEYNSLPSPEQVYAETDCELTKRDVTHDQVSYCANEIESHCRARAVENAIIQGANIIGTEGYDSKIEEMIKEAVTISLNRDIGMSYFDDPLQRLERMDRDPGRISTGWRDVDTVLFGGHARKELLVFSAPSGGGKSVLLQNYGLNMIGQGYNVLYLSLELSEDVIAQRYDTMISEVRTPEWRYHKRKIAEAISKFKNETQGSLTVKRLGSGTTSREIRAFLKEFELKQGFVPDVLIIDYLDIMGANEKVSADNVFEKDKRATEQLRDIANDYNMMVATASQLNRGGVNQERNDMTHVAGGMSKINTSDTWISIISNDVLRAQNLVRLQFLKTRNSDGTNKMITLKWLPNIRVINCDEDTIQTSQTSQITVGTAESTIGTQLGSLSAPRRVPSTHKESYPFEGQDDGSIDDMFDTQ